MVTCDSWAMDWAHGCARLRQNVNDMHDDMVHSCVHHVWGDHDTIMPLGELQCASIADAVNQVAFTSRLSSLCVLLDDAETLTCVLWPATCTLWDRCGWDSIGAAVSRGPVGNDASSRGPPSGANGARALPLCAHATPATQRAQPLAIRTYSDG